MFMKLKLAQGWEPPRKDLLGQGVLSDSVALSNSTLHILRDNKMGQNWNLHDYYAKL